MENLSKNKKLILVGLVTTLAILLCMSIFLVSKNKSKIAMQAGVFKEPISTTTAYNNLSLEKDEHGVTNNYVPEIIGTDYNLYVRQDEYEAQDNFIPEIWYQDLGLVNEGQYKGWKLILGFRGEDDPSGGTQHLFITKDDKTFFVDDQYFTRDGGFHYNKLAVQGSAIIQHPFPKTLVVGGITFIRREFVKNEEFLKQRKGDYGVVNGLRLIGKKANNFSFSTSTKAYIDSQVDIYALNANSIVVSYSPSITSDYEEALTKSITEGTGYISAGFLLKEKRDYLFATTTLMAGYFDYFQFGCGHTGVTLNPQFSSDLEQIGVSKTGEEVYLFKNKDHPLVTLFYDKKLKDTYEAYKSGKDWYLYSTASTTNYKVVPPSFTEYKKKNPVIVIKDKLGRYVVLGEYYYGLEGGCGKPVIYLYPEKETEVSVLFKKAISLTIDIPRYFSGWKVLAGPSGLLKDIRDESEKKSCEKVDFNRHGSEYAKDSCRINQYPYLYWEGVASGEYPFQIDGWVVARGNLNAVMEEKLTALSLSPKEREDMLSYWVPEMMKKNAPYYRISFIQTGEMNVFIPMSISPRPDTTIRVFLDWEPLKEPVEMKPQSLKSTIRKGFTLVEWGGLKR